MNSKIIIILGIIVTVFGCKQKQLNPVNTIETSQLIVDSLYSKSLQEYRFFNIYLPVGYSKEKKLPVVYMSDGQFLVNGDESELYKRGLDSIFKKKSVRKAVIFGINSKTSLIKEGNPISFRHYEYMSALKGRKDDEDSRLENWHENHMTFFTKEALFFAESKYGVSKQREDKIFYGVSNGGGFGITLGVEHPEFFGYLVCYSPGAEVYNEINWDTT